MVMERTLACAVAWMRGPLGMVVLVAVVAAALLAAVPAVLRLPEYPARTAQALRVSEIVTRAGLSNEARLALEKDLLLYETDHRIKIWTAIVQAVGGAALLIGLIFTWRSLRAAQLKLDIDREAQLTNRFTAATSQLGAQVSDGAPNVEARLGGIYALSSIARDSPKDYWPVMEILTAYVRHNARWRDVQLEEASPGPNAQPDQLKPRTDIQAILTILGRSMPPDAKALRLDQKFDLRYTDLRGAEFWDAHLERTDFWGAHLEGAKLWGACLDDAKLVKAHLAGANLREARFDRADLTGATLTGADLGDADFMNAIGLRPEQVASALDNGRGALLPQSLVETSPEAQSKH